MPKKEPTSELPSLKRRGSSLKEFLGKMTTRSSDSSLRSRGPSQSSPTTSTPSLTRISSACDYYSTFVEPRKGRPYLLVTRRKVTRIPHEENPTPRIRIGHAAIIGAFTSPFSAVPTELCSVVLDHNFDKFSEERRKALTEDLEGLLSEIDTKVDKLGGPSHPGTSLEAKEREKLVIPYFKDHQSALSELFDELKIPSDLPGDSKWREYRSVQISRMLDEESVRVLKGHDILHGAACG